MNLLFNIVNFEHVLVSGALVKSTKRIKYTSNNRTVSLKHIHVT